MFRGKNAVLGEIVAFTSAGGDTVSVVEPLKVDRLAVIVVVP